MADNKVVIFEQGITPKNKITPKDLVTLLQTFIIPWPVLSNFLHNYIDKLIGSNVKVEQIANVFIPVFELLSEEQRNEMIQWLYDRYVYTPIQRLNIESWMLRVKRQDLYVLVNSRFLPYDPLDDEF